MSTVMVQLEEDGALAVVTLNRPEVNNCFNNDTVLELAAVWKRLANDKEVKCAIFTGNGKSFSAGVDLSSPPDAHAQASDTPEGLAQNPVYQMDQCKFPIIGVRWRTC